MNEASCQGQIKSTAKLIDMPAYRIGKASLQTEQKLQMQHFTQGR